MFKGIIPFAHQLLRDCVQEGDTVIDATCGNGNDTLFLCQLVGNFGHVYGFDIQKQAIETTQALINGNGYTNISLIHDSHEKIDQYIPQKLHNKVGGAIFNLGYLPRSDKQIITKSESTLAAINSLLKYIRVGAYIVIVVYHGHEGGKEEKRAVMDYVRQLDQQQYAVIQYQFINQKNNPPFVVAIEKK